MDDLIDDATSILTAPFVGSLDLAHLFLLVGVVMVIIAMWVLILHSVTVTASEVI